MIEKRLEEPIHEEMGDLLPLPTVEAIVIKDNKILLGKRSKGIGRDYWWVFGGKVRKWELLEDAVKRILYTETGLIGIPYKQLLSKSYFFCDRHTVGTPFLVSINKEHTIKLNDTHSEYKWVSKEELVDLQCHPMLHGILLDGGFFDE